MNAASTRNHLGYTPEQEDALTEAKVMVGSELRREFTNLLLTSAGIWTRKWKPASTRDVLVYNKHHAAFVCLTDEDAAGELGHVFTELLTL